MDEFCQFCKVGYLKVLRIILSTLVLICFVSEQAGAQSNYDTLYYHDNDPNKVIAFPLTYPASVETLAVKFEPVNNRSYSIREIHLLIAPDTAGWYKTHNSVPIYIHSAGTDTSPGKILLEIPVTVNDSSEIYPYWKIMKLSSYPELNGLIGDFWVSSLTVLSSLVHNPLSTYNENTFGYSNMRWTNKYTPGFFIRAVVEYEGMGINEKKDAEYPVEFLTYNYPNPFNIATVITYKIIHDCNVNLVIYNVNGKKVRTFFPGDKKPGVYSIIWDGRDDKGRIVSAGVYLCRFEVQFNGKKYTSIKKMLFLK